MADAAEKLIDEIVDDAYGPLAPFLPPDVLALFRAELADALATHPYGSLLVRRALPDAVVEASGDVERDASAALTGKGKAGSGTR